MKVEAFVINKDDCIAVLYVHETLGRVLAIRGEINPEFTVSIHPIDEESFKPIHVDMLEFILKVIPNEPKTETQPQ